MFNLARMNNNDLEMNLKDLVSKERKLLHFILVHIKEIDSRRIFLERAYSSMYEYLMGECGYSGSAAILRLCLRMTWLGCLTISGRFARGAFRGVKIKKASFLSVAGFLRCSFFTDTMQL